MPNGITINQNTTLHQIGDFLKNDANQDRRLLARENKNGEVVLYTKPQSKTLMDKLSSFVDRKLGRTDRREARANDIILKAFDKFTATHQTKGVFKNVKTAIGEWAANRQLTGRAVANLTTIMRDIPVKSEKLPPGPTLGSLGISKDGPLISDIVKKIADSSRDEDGLSPLGSELGKGLVDEITARHPDGVRDDFAMSNGVKLTRELRDALKEKLAGMTPPVEVDETALNRMVTVAFREAASQIRDDGVIQGTTKTVDWKTANGMKQAEAPHIEIGGKQYEPTKVLGSGGFGQVFEYASVEDPSKKIAVKISFAQGLEQPPLELSGSSVEEYGQKVKTATDEIDLHRTAYGKGSEQVVGYVSHFRMPDGNIAVAMEIAPNGGVDEMGKSLAQAVKDGVLSNDEANVLRLTMLQDITKGLQHMHVEQKVTHLDFKPPNCFIGTDGTAKVGDFGLTARLNQYQEDGPSVRLVDVITPDNPIYNAPEILGSKATVDRMGREESRDFETKSQETTMRILRDILPRGTKDAALKALAGSVKLQSVEDLKEQNIELKSGLKFDHKVDVWGLGLSAVELFSGNIPFSHVAFVSDIETSLQNYMTNPENRPLSDPEPDGKPKPGSIGAKTGNAQIDDLMTRMLMPRPEQREGTTQLLNHAAFRMPGVGSKEARDLIVALKGKDPEKIESAKRALSALPPPNLVSNASPSGEDRLLSVDEVFELLGGEQNGRV